MKTKRIIVSIALVIVGFLVLSLVFEPVYGQNRRGRRQMRNTTFGMLSDRLLDALELTQEQETKVEDVKNTFWETRRAFLGEFIPVWREVADKLLGPDSVTEGDVAAQISQLAGFSEQYRRDGLKMALELREMLTPEQLARATEITQEARNLRGELRGLYRGQ